jgi:hypothetical protein
MIVEKLITGIKETERLYDFANLSGKDVIKLVLTQQRLPIFEITNFEIPLGTGVIDANSVVDGVSVNFEKGSLFFYPDQSSILWGYLIDTEFNRNQLAGCLNKNWFRIIDSKLRAEIAELALTLGYDIEKNVTKLEKHSPREQEALEKAKRIEEENAQLKKDMATIMTQFKELKDSVTKPDEKDVSFSEPIVEKTDGRRRGIRD